MTAAWGLRMGGPVAAIGGLGWIVFGPMWRNPDGALAATACLPIAIVVGLGILTVVARTPFVRPGLWFSLGLVSQAAVLQLIDAGPAVHYQHYPPVGRLISLHPGILTFLAIQAGIVAAAWIRWAAARAIQVAPTTGFRLGIALVLSVGTAATVSPDPRRFAAELVFAAILQMLAIATMLLVPLSLPDGARERVTTIVDRWLGTNAGDSTPGRRDRFGWAAGALATALAVALNVLSYERFPHIPDEVVYLLHARYFADGMLTMPIPASPAAFEVDLMSYEPTRWFSPVPPGWPAVLAIGTFFGAPSLVNPLLAGACVVMTYVLLKELYSRRVARYATALLAVSPWFLFLGMSYMTHMLTLTCALVAAIGVMRARRAGSFAWAVVGGVGVGATSWIRPLDGLLVGILIALWALGFGARRLRIPALAGLLLGTVVTGALIYPYNRALTGDGLKFPINAYTDRLYGPNTNAYGFGKDRGLGFGFDPNPGHGPVDGLINTDLNAFSLSTDLFGWSGGSLILVALLLCSGRLTRPDRSMIAVVVVITTGYFFYYFSGGPDFGARYWFPVVVPLVALSARAVEVIESRAGARAGLLVSALVVASLVAYVPWRGADKYWHFRGMRSDLRTLAADAGFARDLVFVRGERFPDYAAAITLNPIDFHGADPIYAWDRSADVRQETLRAYADRRVWVVDGPSVTGAGFRLVDGPFAPGVLTSGALPR